MAKKKRVLSGFVVFTCCIVISTFRTSDQGSLLTVSVDGSWSCCMTIMQLAFFPAAVFVEKKTRYPINCLVNTSDVIVTCTKSTFVRNKTAVDVHTVIFVIVMINNLCKVQMFTVNVEFPDRKDTFVVLFSVLDCWSVFECLYGSETESCLFKMCGQFQSLVSAEKFRSI